MTSEVGTPLPGTAISIDSLKLGAMTDENGRYTFTVPARYAGTARLGARRMGHKFAAVVVTLGAGAVKQDFELKVQALQLTGLVVSALSVQREKATIGTSQQEISSEALTRTRTPNLINAMSGKVSGVTIQSSGNMGGSARLVIRGPTSILGNNEPLFIVDGVPVSNQGFSAATAGGGTATSTRDYGNGIADLNPDDIATYTVLKGPNAAALYGSRASNGAVVITTKSGSGGGTGVHWSLGSYLTMDSYSTMPKLQNRYGQGFGGEFSYVDGAGGGINDGADESWGPKMDGRLIDQFNGKALPFVPHPNNVAEYFQTGRTVANNLSATASGERMGARLSVTKENTRGIAPNASLAKLTAALSASVVLNPRVTLAGSLQYVQNSGLNRPEVGYTEGNPFMGFTWFGRQVDSKALKSKFYNEDGSLYNWNTNYHTNPFWQQQANSEQDSRDRTIAQATATVSLTPWLKGIARVGQDGYRYTAEEHMAAGNLRANPAYNGALTNNGQRATEANVEGLLTASGTLLGIDLSTTVGGNQRRNTAVVTTYSTFGLLVPGLYNLSNAGIVPTYLANEFHSGVNSVYGSMALTWKHAWTVEGTARNDWSSTLPKANASYFYPSVNTSVLLSDLFPAITRANWVSYLKVRGGWAQVGSDAAPYQLATIYNGLPNKLGGRSLFTLNNTTANELLKPEITTGKEAGVEIGFFDNRVTLDATLYEKRTKNQIIPLTVPPSTGFATASVNAGSMRNRGIEALLTVRALQLKNGFSWTSTINASKNRNVVESLMPGLATTIIATNWSTNIEARVGYPYGVLFGYKWLRDSATKQLIVGGDGLPIRDPVRRLLGNINPNWVGGVANEFRYRNLALNVLVDVRSGGQNFSSGNWFGSYAGVLASTLKGREVDWDNPGILVQGIVKGTGMPNTQRVHAEDYYHNWFYAAEDAVLPTGYVKLREVRFSWDVPSKYVSQLNLSALNVSAVGRNLWTHTKFPNYDPENAVGTGNAGQGFDFGAMPTTRTFGLNFTITP